MQTESIVLTINLKYKSPHTKILPKICGYILQIICLANLTSGIVEVASSLDSTGPAHKRLHFCVTIRRMIAPAPSLAETRGYLPSTIPSLLIPRHESRMDAATVARVQTPSNVRSFIIHPSIGEAVSHVPVAERNEGLRVAAMVEVARLGNMCNTIDSPWVLNLPNTCRRHLQKLLSDDNLHASTLEGVETRRLIAERAAMQQPK